MDSWDTGAGATDAWSTSTVDYGNNIGRSYSNNTTLTGAEPTTPSTPSFSAGSGGGGGGGGGGYSRRLNPKAQLSIERMPYETSVETIRNIFGRYGRISRVICDYKIAEESLYVWLDYEDERFCEAALRESGRKMEKSTIVVQKCANSGGGDDSFRTNRGPKKDAWGNNTWGSRGDRSGGGGGGGGASSTPSASSADWSTDWGSSGTDNQASSGFDASFDGEDRRSSRGRGRGGGGRGRGGSRYQPYDKNDSFGEKPAVPAWEDVIGSKPSTSSASGTATSAASDWNSDAAWGSGNDEGNKSKSDTSFSQQSTQPSGDTFGGWD